MKKLLAQLKSALINHSAEGYIDTAMKMIISVVIGGVLLAGLYNLFNAVLLPLLVQHIQSMFS